MDICREAQTNPSTNDQMKKHNYMALNYITAV